MVVILNNYSSFQFSKVHAQFQGCWHKKSWNPYAWLLLTVMKKKLFIILAMISIFKTKNSVYNSIGLEDSCICDHCLAESFCKLRLLKTHFL